MKRKIISYIALVLALGIIIFLVSKYINTNKSNSNNKPNSSPNIETKSFTFRKYTYYNIPTNLTFSTFEDKIFKISSDGWYATVELLHDPDGYVIKYNKEYKDMLKEDGYIIDDTSLEQIENNYVVIHKSIFDNKNIVIADYTNREGFAYEIKIFNDNDSYDMECLKDIIKTLNNGKYDETNTEKYHYTYPFKEWKEPEE